MTREEREKAAWLDVNRGGGASVTVDTPSGARYHHKPDGTHTAIYAATKYGECPELIDGAELIQLRDALNHRIRELGVEDPLEKEIAALKEIKAAWENYE